MDAMRKGNPMKLNRNIVLFGLVLLAMSGVCVAQKKKLLPRVVAGEFCQAPKLTAPGPGYQTNDVKDQPDKTADLPSVVQTVEQALKCYQAMTGSADPNQPKGLPKLSSAVMDFRTTTARSVGFSISFFIFKIGASREKDATDDISFTYSVPKTVVLPKTASLARPAPSDLFSELVKDVQAAANSAKSQSTALGMPLSKVQITIAYGIKFDGNVSINAPVQLVTIGGNGDYNKNNTQTITLTFGE